jgi:4-diphosphocytidyl-2-C-methyl-D-erythritol kinase
VIERYKQMMLAKGAMASMMSGSGPTVFALAKNREQAEEIAGFMRQEKNADVFVTRTFQLNRMKA